MLLVIRSKIDVLTVKRKMCQDAARTGSAADRVVAVFKIGNKMQSVQTFKLRIVIF